MGWKFSDRVGSAQLANGVTALLEAEVVSSPTTAAGIIESKVHGVELLETHSQGTRCAPPIHRPQGDRWAAVPQPNGCAY
jgi:hypothetical protein